MAHEESSVSARGVGQEEPERVQHQPDATERLAALMAQYMEFQMARPARGTTLHEQFMKLNPPEFVGAIDPLVAEEWLKKLDAIFEVMEGLDWQIRSRVSMFEINKYSELVNKVKIAERDVMEFQNRREHFKKRRFDSGAGPSRQRPSDVTTTTEQRRAQTDVGSERPGSSRGGGNSRGRGSWSPPARPNTARSGTTGGIVCYRCGIEGHMIRDCPMPWVDKCYQCGQPGHIARHCTQEPIAASSVGSAVGRGRGQIEVHNKGKQLLQNRVLRLESMP
ncbi:hypothetical protein Acr_00g0050120 [Actinidia rufa]|uniref:CCHC-type domain-containing protein n=1 Tax=Actinidia rufa TaxID=165716 RepID=A0A7J0DM19_9ERIC|nr:hypothetical protein Acr_00g0050120 [Actinidia rufa]